MKLRPFMSLIEEKIVINIRLWETGVFGNIEILISDIIQSRETKRYLVWLIDWVVRKTLFQKFCSIIFCFLNAFDNLIILYLFEL